VAGAPAGLGVAAIGGFVCPRCRGVLLEQAGGAACARCGSGYGRHHGILDLRVGADGYLSPGEDRARADLVVAALDDLALPELLAYYWSLSATTPVALRATFVRSALRAEARASHLLARMADDGVRLGTARVLDVGSGTGGFLAAAQGRVREVVGLDIAMRWLHLSRRRFRDRASAVPPLVCACAEGLPFADGAFDVVVSTGTLEFARDLDRVLAECARVLRPGGRAYLTVVNRYALAPEPHVGLWAVGWLPRAWQAGYVRRRGRGDFASVRLPSLAELRRAAARHFAERRIEPARLPADLAADLPLRARLALRAYDAMGRLRPLRTALRRFGPEWDVTLTRG
jgi:SAM-dependent methyltransferase